MKTKKIILGTVSGTVAMFLFGFTIYGVLLAEFMNTHSNPAIARPMEEMLFPVMLLSNCLWALLYSIIIDWSNNHGLAGGAKVGAVTGFLAILALNLTFFATSTVHNNDTILVLVDSIAFGILSAISGAVAGWVIQKVGSAKAAVA